MQQHVKLGELNGPWSVLARLNWILSPPILVALIGFCVGIINQINEHERRLAVIAEWQSGRMAAWEQAERRMTAFEKVIDDIEKSDMARQVELTKVLVALDGRLTAIDARLADVVEALKLHTKGNP